MLQAVDLCSTLVDLCLRHIIWEWNNFSLQYKSSATFVLQKEHHPQVPVGQWLCFWDLTAGTAVSSMLGREEGREASHSLMEVLQ